MSNVILRTVGLSAGYKKQDVIVDVNLDFVAGKVYSIIGPNGCGKTTLLRVLSRILHPSAGQVWLDGQNLAKMNTRLVARQLAILAQNNVTMSDVSVRSLIQYGRFAHRQWWRGNTSEDERIVDWALEMTGLEPLADRKLTDLSGGERQRAWIAMSVAQKPRVLLLDEPTTYLDIAHQLDILELVRRLNQQEGMTMIMVMHDINQAARFSDELIVLQDRQVYRRGDPWSILTGDTLETVFQVEADLIADRHEGTPIFTARRVIRNP